MSTHQILIGMGESQVCLDSRFANRHGLIAGATGTGKTITLQVLAESFSKIGVPVFVADVKGDLSGISQPGKPHEKIDERVEKIGISDFEFAGSPTVFWDLFSKQGHPIRATVSDMGPMLLSRLLGLNEVQEGIMTAAFQFADDQKLLLLDLKDLRTILTHIGDNAKAFKNTYGNVSANSVGAIMRRLLVLEREGAKKFFGEPALGLPDLIHTDKNGRGQVNVLAADKLMQSPRLYSTFLLWLLSELFETLPEIGDPDKPVFVFFFDEAHLLFDEAPKVLLQKVEQVVRLIRSKGVGIYFITQNPMDIPDGVLGQLGNRVQHALRAFTPKDQKTVRAAAETFRANPKLNTAKVIRELNVGEALVSVLENKGRPSVVQRTLIRPPTSRMGPITAAQRKELVADSVVQGRYDTAVDRESAHEMLAKRANKMAREAEQQEAVKKKAKKTTRRSNRQSVGEAFAKSVSRAIGSQIGRQIVRGLLGSLFRGR